MMIVRSVQWDTSLAQDTRRVPMYTDAEARASEIKISSGQGRLAACHRYKSMAPGRRCMTGTSSPDANMRTENDIKARLTLERRAIAGHAVFGTLYSHHIAWRGTLCSTSDVVLSLFEKWSRGQTWIHRSSRG